MMMHLWRATLARPLRRPFLLPLLFAAAFALAPLAHAAGTVNFGNKPLVDPTLGTIVRSTGSVTATSNTTLANVPGLAITLTSGAHYICEGNIFVSSVNASGGIKIGTGTSGSLTVSNFRSWTWIWNNGTVQAAGTGGVFNGSIGGFTGTATNVTFLFEIDPSATDVLTITAAQNASFATSTVTGAPSSYLRCEKTSN